TGPKRVGGADSARRIVRFRPGQRRFLMREDQIGADIAARGKRLQKVAKVIRRNGLAAVLARNAAGLEPIIVNERRTRMFDRPADHASGGRSHASSTTEFCSKPISGLSTPTRFEEH